jgi:hypothetical protein
LSVFNLSLLGAPTIRKNAVEDKGFWGCDNDFAKSRASKS